MMLTLASSPFICSQMFTPEKLNWGPLKGTETTQATVGLFLVIPAWFFKKINLRATRLVSILDSALTGCESHFYIWGSFMQWEL